MFGLFKFIVIFILLSPPRFPSVTSWLLFIWCRELHQQHCTSGTSLVHTLIMNGFGKCEMTLSAHFTHLFAVRTMCIAISSQSQEMWDVGGVQWCIGDDRSTAVSRRCHESENVTAEQDGDGTFLLFLLCLMRLQYQDDIKGYELCRRGGAMHWWWWWLV